VFACGKTIFNTVVFGHAIDAEGAASAGFVPDTPALTSKYVLYTPCERVERVHHKKS
jgi:hypothetical protein